MLYETLGHKPVEKGFNFSFEECSAGWIYTRLRHWRDGFTESVVIHCSICGDPFPDFIAWMEAITRGVDEACWTVNEEGCLARLRAERGGDRWQLTCEGNSESPGEAPWQSRMQFDVRAYDLICAGYYEFRRFVESHHYRPEEWTNETVFDCWKHRLHEGPCFTMENAVDLLARWNRDEVLAALFYAEPGFRDDRPEAPQIPTDWNAASADARKEAARTLLRRRHDGYGGSDLQALKSPMIEEWVAAQDKQRRPPRPPA